MWRISSNVKRCLCVLLCKAKWLCESGGSFRVMLRRAWLAWVLGTRNLGTARPGWLMFLWWCCGDTVAYRLKGRKEGYSELPQNWWKTGPYHSMNSCKNLGRYRSPSNFGEFLNWSIFKEKWPYFRCLKTHIFWTPQDNLDFFSSKNVELL